MLLYESNAFLRGIALFLSVLCYSLHIFNPFVQSQCTFMINADILTHLRVVVEVFLGDVYGLAQLTMCNTALLPEIILAPLC